MCAGVFGEDLGVLQYHLIVRAASSLTAFLNNCLKPSSTLVEPELLSGAQGHFLVLRAG